MLCSFLKKLYSNSLECPRSYDKLRFDPRYLLNFVCISKSEWQVLLLTLLFYEWSLIGFFFSRHECSKEKCRLLVTHDDYSITSKLHRDRTSVVTILRNPVDRVFSTYEFSIEVAARFLVHPNLTSATQMTRHLRSKTKGVSTLDIWPWKYLVPWMREDLFARVFFFLYSCYFTSILHFSMLFVLLLLHLMRDLSFLNALLIYLSITLVVLRRSEVIKRKKLSSNEYCDFYMEPVCLVNIFMYEIFILTFTLMSREKLG